MSGLHLSRSATQSACISAWHARLRSRRVPCERSPRPVSARPASVSTPGRMRTVMGATSIGAPPQSRWAVSATAEAALL